MAERMTNDARRAGDVLRSIRAMAMRAKPALVLLNLDDMIEEALSTLHHEISAREITLDHARLRRPLEIRGDRTQLIQVFVNLLMNAMQAVARPESAVRRVSIRSESDGTSGLRCIIEDSGPGLEPSLSSKVFESFYTTKRDGMGIGLSICKSIIEAHGGTITASNASVHGGARFEFTLPAAAGS